MPRRKPITADSAAPLTTLYFISGIPALIYQTAWQRLLVLHSGVGTVSVAIIVSSYMLGMGIGSLLGAALTRRLSRESALRLFAAAELCICAFALLSPWLLYRILYRQYGHLYAQPLQAATLHFLVLLLPTALMGITLPLLTHALVRESTEAATRINRLYGVNTLGAAFGALLCPWILMPLGGIQTAVGTGAACNLLVALSVSWLRGRDAALRRNRISTHPHIRNNSIIPPENSDSDTASPSTSLRDSLSTWLLLCFLSGFTAIGLELLWFRILDVAVKSTAWTFGTVLACLLGCMAFGSLAGRRLRRTSTPPFTMFLQTQCLILIIAASTPIAVTALPVDLPGIAEMTDYWAAEEPFRPSLQEIPRSLLLYLAQPLLLLGLPAILMGYSFNLLQQGVQQDSGLAGYRVGLLQAANILGCTVGSLVVGIPLTGLCGSLGTLRLLSCCGLLFAAVGLRHTTARRRFTLLAAVLLLLIPLIPSNQRFWRHLHGQPADSTALIAEDVTGVCMLAPRRNADNWWLWVGGKTQSLLPWGGFHARLGILPVTLHEHPEDVAIIGLGSGTTAWAAACRPDTKQIRVFEICTAEETLLRSPFALGQWPELRDFLDDKRIHIDGVDARFSLMTSNQKWDVIEADAIRHHSAFAGYLYSKEFFLLCADRLKPGGCMCTWAPTPLVAATFRQVFPWVLEMENGLLLIGANQPLNPDPHAWEQRLRKAAPHVPGPILDECRILIPAASILPPASAEEFTNTDLYPFDEFH
jgi:spermidine synthase